MQSQKKGLQQGQPAKYRIVVQTSLRESWSDWLDAMAINVEKSAAGPTFTTLTGTVRDQAGLHGLLNRIRDLNIVLISVQLIHPITKRREKNGNQRK